MSLMDDLRALARLEAERAQWACRVIDAKTGATLLDGVGDVERSPEPMLVSINFVPATHAEEAEPQRSTYQPPPARIYSCIIDVDDDDATTGARRRIGL